MEQHTNNLNGTSELHPIRTLHLFAGAGGGILADLLLGHRPVCAVEIDQHCQQVLSQRQKDGVLPWFPIFEDVTTFDGRPWRGLVEAICGGFPCQDISSAGTGKGIDGERSGLWAEFFRIIREVGPGIVFVENSPLLTSRGLGRVLSDLASLGYHAKWGVLGTSDVGGHCKGERIWIVATSSESRWEKLVCRESGFGSKAGPGREAVDAYPHRRIDRIRELESMVGEPAILGSNDGMANRLGRLHAIGNGQNPIVAATAWRVLT